MARREMPPGDLDQAMERAKRDHLRQARRTRIKARVGLAILVGLALGAAVFVFATVRYGADNDSTEARSPHADKPESPFDFSDAVPLCLERDGAAIRVRVPPTFGRATRVALVSADLESTPWEAEASPAVKVLSFEVGVAPAGFTESHALQGDMPMEAILVINGPDNIGLSLIAPRTIGVPGSCT